MPSGDMRRPPSVWEQRLAGRVNAVALGIDSAASSVVRSDDSASTSYSEPEDTILAAGAPSTPTLTPTFKGLAVTWDGLDVDGDAYNGANQWVQVHVSTTSNFTPSSSTLMGHLYEPGTFIVSPLTPGAAYYVKFVGIDETGTVTDASVEAAETSAKVNGATDIVANSISANLISAGTITGWYISGGTVQGARFRTADSGARVEMGDATRLGYIEFYASSGTAAVQMYKDLGDLYITGATVNRIYGAVRMYSTLKVDSNLDAGGTIDVGYSGSDRALSIDSSGNVFSMGITKGTTADAANVRVAGTVGGGQLYRSTSSARYKDNILTLGPPIEGVDADRLSAGLGDVDVYDVLSVSPAQFHSLATGDGDASFLGFIAEDVAAKFPWAADYDGEGRPESVKDRPILAALLAVVQDQQSAITALSARIDELEAR